MAQLLNGNNKQTKIKSLQPEIGTVLPHAIQNGNDSTGY